MFICFLVGVGVKKGFSYGESDEFGFKVVVNGLIVYDFNVMLLYLLGFNYE